MLKCSFWPFVYLHRRDMCSRLLQLKLKIRLSSDCWAVIILYVFQSQVLSQGPDFPGVSQLVVFSLCWWYSSKKHLAWNRITVEDLSVILQRVRTWMCSLCVPELWFAHLFSSKVWQINPLMTWLTPPRRLLRSWICLCLKTKPKMPRTSFIHFT